MSHTNPAEHLDTRTVVALCLVGTLAWMTMTLLPYEVASLAFQYEAGSVGAGWIVAAELLAVAASAAWFGRKIDSEDKRRLAVLGVFIALLASVGSVYSDSLRLLVVCRLAFGIGCGMLAAATIALPALAADPQRVFAYMQLALGIAFGIVTFAGGYGSQHLGREYVFLIELGFLVLLGGAAFLLPRGVREPGAADSTGPKGKLSSPVIACIAAAGLTWTALSAVWAFAEQAATAAGISATDLVIWFGISGLLTPLGGLIAAVLGERKGYTLPLVAGFLTLAAVCVAMYVARTPNTYIIGILLLNFPMTFVMSYVMAVLAGLDHSGRGASVGGAAINLGGAAGPAMGAIALSSTDLSIVGFLGAAILVAALLLAVSASARLGQAVA